VIGYGIDWIVKGKSGFDKGCKRSEFSWTKKTLVLQEAYTSCSEPNHVHTQAALLVGNVHMHAALLTCSVPVDKLVYVED
jgi:hypothetical protein